MRYEARSVSRRPLGATGSQAADRKALSYHGVHSLRKGFHDCGRRRAAFLVASAPFRKYLRGREQTGVVLAGAACGIGMRDATLSEQRGFGPTAGGGWLVDESLFRFLVDFEVQKAQRLRYSVSLVCFAVEPSAAGNGEATPASVAESIVRYLRGTDAVALWDRGWLAMLLVDAETTHLPSILDRLTTRLETPGWSAGGSCYPRTAARADDMLRQAAGALTRAKEEGGNRLYVAS